MTMPLTPDKIALIRERRAGGAELRTIAAELGVGTATVHRYALCAGIPVRTANAAAGPWTDEKVARLRHLWNVEKLPAMEIAAALNTSKNAVIGKARRIGCDVRESPIKPLAPGDVRKHPVGRTRGPTLPSMAKPVSVVSIIRREARPLPTPRVETPAQPVLRFSKRPCCFPIGDPGTKSFRYCNAPETVFNKPYCVTHCAVSYVRVRDRREDEAA